MAQTHVTCVNSDVTGMFGRTGILHVQHMRRLNRTETYQNVCVIVECVLLWSCDHDVGWSTNFNGRWLSLGRRDSHETCALGAKMTV